MKLAVIVPYWSGDAKKAFDLLDFIAELEPKFRDDVIVCPVPRWDMAKDGSDDFPALRAKFPVFNWRSVTPGDGWPDGCNAMALDIYRMAEKRWEDGWWQDVGACLLMEPDAVPISKSWLDELKLEWLNAVAYNPEVLVVGSWRNSGPYPCGHINGNCLFHPMLARRVDIEHVPPGLAYDCALAPQLRHRWKISGLFKNLFQSATATEEMLTTPEVGERRPVIVHGVKDGSALEYARRTLL